MKRNFFIYNILYLLFVIQIHCQKGKIDELTSCNITEGSKNKFILKTDLSQNELEQIFSKNFSMPTKHNKNRKQNYRHKNDVNENVKEFKSKDNLNKTILLLEIDNITDIPNENDSNNNNNHYELIDVHNETKIFLSFDKFFRTQYQEMFEYSYTIVIFFLILIIIVIYYAFILPNEAPDWNINSPVATNTSRKNRNINIDNEYILKDNDI